MSGSLRPARLIIAIAAALLVAYAVIWTQVSTFDVGRSDFTAFYVGGTLLREGHTGDLYSQALQQPLHSALIAPDREANLPFVNTPVAAALVLPATFLPLDAAYRVWSLLELAVLILAVVLAVRSVDWPAEMPRIWRVAAGAAALAGMGTWTMFVQAQWTPLLALGIVLAYRSWKRGHLATGAALLVVSAGIAKPHLALGLLAFLAGWRERRVIMGALLGVAGLAVASLLLVGPAGVEGFVSILASSTTRWELATMVSFIGVVGSLFGNGLTAHLIGLFATLLACAAAVWLGMRVRRDPKPVGYGARRRGGAVAGRVPARLSGRPGDAGAGIRDRSRRGSAAHGCHRSTDTPFARRLRLRGVGAHHSRRVRRSDRRGDVPARAARRVGARRCLGARVLRNGQWRRGRRCSEAAHLPIRSGPDS